MEISCIGIVCVLGSLPVLAFVVVGYLCHKADQARFKEYKEYYASILKKDDEQRIMSTWTKKEMETLNYKVEDVQTGYLCNGRPTSKTRKFAGTMNPNIGFAISWYECDHCERVYGEEQFDKTHPKQK